MSARSEQTAKEIFRPERGSSPVVWLLVLLFALIVGRDLIPLIALLTLIAYGKFACEDLLTAHWLRRRDPYPERGRACAIYCLSRSVLKAVVAALSLASIVYAPVAGMGGWRRVDPGLGVQGTMLAGIAVYVVISIAGWWSARTGGVRIWIDSGLNRSRRRGVWPPRCQGSSNEADDAWLAIAACLVTLLVQPPGDWIYSDAGLVAGGILAASFVAMHLLTRRIVAATPEECWYSKSIKIFDSAETRGT
jgi:hypothetical protein